MAICALAAWLIFSRRDRAAKSVFGALILLLFSVVVCYILQRTGFFTVVSSAERLQAYLEKAGAWMPALYVLLQFLQVVILPIPSVVSTVAGVALFGALWASIYSLLGILLGSLTAFIIGRKLGERAVSWMVGGEALQRWKKKLKGKDNLCLTLMFVLPLFPDDILCFFAGLSTMTLRYFLTVVFLARSIGIVATCYSFDLIPFSAPWGIAVWLVFAVCLAIIFVWTYKNIDRIHKLFIRRGKRKK